MGSEMCIRDRTSVVPFAESSDSNLTSFLGQTWFIGWSAWLELSQSINILQTFVDFLPSPNKDINILWLWFTNVNSLTFLDLSPPSSLVTDRSWNLKE